MEEGACTSFAQVFGSSPQNPCGPLKVSCSVLPEGRREHKRRAGESWIKTNTEHLLCPTGPRVAKEKINSCAMSSEDEAAVAATGVGAAKESEEPDEEGEKGARFEASPAASPAASLAASPAASLAASPAASLAASPAASPAVVRSEFSFAGCLSSRSSDTLFFPKSKGSLRDARRTSTVRGLRKKRPSDERGMQRKSRSACPLLQINIGPEAPLLTERTEETFQTERLHLLAEEKLSWDAFALPERNRRRLAQEHANRVKATEKKQKDGDDDNDGENGFLRESGFFYQHGRIVSLSRWRDSPAKFRTYQGHRDGVFALAVSNDQKYVLSASADATVRLWELESALCVQVLEGHTDEVSSRLAVGMSKNLWSYLLCAFPIQVRDCAFCHGFDPASSSETLRSFVSGARDCSVRVWRAGEAQSFRSFECFGAAVYCVDLSRGGDVALSAGQDGCIRLWDIPQGHLRFVYKAHSSAILQCAYSPTSRYILSASDAGERLVKVRAHSASKRLETDDPPPCHRRSGMRRCPPSGSSVASAFAFFGGTTL
eukprot:scaffold1638_cov258-Pinguiococcus_pyrenoidosus.AAC.3